MTRTYVEDVTLLAENLKEIAKKVNTSSLVMNYEDETKIYNVGNSWIDLTPTSRIREINLGPYQESITSYVFMAEAGHFIDWHTHEQEERVHVVKGRIRQSSGVNEFVVGEGESFVVPPNVRHRSLFTQDSIIYLTFKPKLHLIENGI